MFGTISAAYKIWTALESDPRSASAREYEAAEAMLMTGEPQSLADIALILRALARRVNDENRPRLLQMSEYLDASLDNERGAAPLQKASAA